MPRAKTVLRREPQLELVRLFEPPPPRVRADCLEGGFNANRPCEYLKCRYHLAGELDPDSGDYVSYHRDDPAGVRVETCALDVASRGAHSLEEIAAVLGINVSRVAVI